MLKKSFKYGTFYVYVNGEFILTVRCSYGDVLDLVWPIHYCDPTADIEIVTDVN